MVSLIGVPLEEVKKVFVEWAKDCRRFSEILGEEKQKSNTQTYTSDVVNKAATRFEREYNIINTSYPL